MEEIQIILNNLIHKGQLDCKKCPLTDKCEVYQKNPIKEITKMRRDYLEGALSDLRYDKDTQAYKLITGCTVQMLSEIKDRCVKTSQEIKID